MPHIDRLGIIHISDDDATLIDVGDPDGPAWDMFQAAHTIHSHMWEITNMIKEEA